jgi:hypothetical protein
MTQATIDIVLFIIVLLLFFALPMGVAFVWGKNDGARGCPRQATARHASLWWLLIAWPLANAVKGAYLCAYEIWKKPEHTAKGE